MKRSARFLAVPIALLPVTIFLLTACGEIDSAPDVRTLECNGVHSAEVELGSAARDVADLRPAQVLKSARP